MPISTNKSMKIFDAMSVNMCSWTWRGSFFFFCSTVYNFFFYPPFTSQCDNREMPICVLAYEHVTLVSETLSFSLCISISFMHIILRVESVILQRLEVKGWKIIDVALARARNSVLSSLFSMKHNSKII